MQHKLSQVLHYGLSTLAIEQSSLYGSLHATVCLTFSYVQLESKPSVC